MAYLHRRRTQGYTKILGTFQVGAVYCLSTGRQPDNALHPAHRAQPHFKDNMTNRQWWWTGSALLVLILITAATVGLVRERAAAAGTLSTVKVTRGNVQETVSAVGVLAPSQYVDVGAQVSGQLTEIKVNLGDAVQQGQFIAQIDPTQYTAQVAEDRASIADLTQQLAGWQARLDLARWTLERNTRLAPQGGATEQALQQSKSDQQVATTTIASLRAQIEKAQAALKVDQANLDYTRITAPISGIVMSPTSTVYGNTWAKLDIAHVGQILNNRQNAPVLLRLANLERILVRAQVSEADVPRLAPGMPVYFTTLGQPKRRIDGHLETVESTPELINGAIFYDADFEVPNPDHSLLPQMSAQVFFVIGEARDALVVPLSALASVQRQVGERGASCRPKTSPNTDCLRVLVNGQPQMRAVKVGIRNEVEAQILQGVEVGDAVVIGLPRAGGSHGPEAGGPGGR
jgi:macrolide-specific efflux system membrane fusion protein